MVPCSRAYLSKILVLMTRLTYPAMSGVGTYSYSVGPNISDRIRTTSGVTITPIGPPATFNASGAQTNLRVPPVGTDSTRYAYSYRPSTP